MDWKPRTIQGKKKYLLTSKTTTTLVPLTTSEDRSTERDGGRTGSEHLLEEPLLRLRHRVTNLTVSFPCNLFPLLYLFRITILSYPTPFTRDVWVYNIPFRSWERTKERTKKKKKKNRLLEQENKESIPPPLFLKICPHSVSLNVNFV